MDYENLDFHGGGGLASSAGLEVPREPGPGRSRQRRTGKQGNKALYALMDGGATAHRQQLRQPPRPAAPCSTLKSAA